MKTIYSNTLIKIPLPELYVLYNGLEQWGNRDEFTLKLSDAFLIKGSDQNLEVPVKVININHNIHNPILEKSHTLNEYSIFIGKIRESLDGGLDRDEAIEKAIKECISGNIMSEFLKKHGGEIYNMIYQEFNLETALEVAKEEGIEVGRSEGEAVGIKKGIEVGIRRLSITLASLDLPMEVRIEKLYKAYPEEKSLVDKILEAGSEE